MRHLKEYLLKCAKGGMVAQRSNDNNRLSAALKHKPTRSLESTLWFVIVTFNPLNGNLNYIELIHEIENGNNRWNIYINGKRRARGWSKTGFCRWLFSKIDSVIIY